MTNTINCDHCGHEIDIDQAINSKLQADINAKNKLLDEREQTIESETIKANQKQEEIIESRVKERAAAWEEKVLAANNDINAKNKLLDEREQTIAAETIKANQKQEEIIESRVKEEKALFSKTIKSDLEANFKLEMKEADDVRLELIEQKRINVKLKTNNTTAENDYKLDGDLRVVEAIRLEKQKAAEREGHKDQENEEKMRQLKKSIKDSHRQVNQGSMQIQGEAQELSIESYLKTEYRTDIIEPIKKGDYGADCLQYVNTIDMKNCGVIYYESKNTKQFNNQWIEKFKTDMREKKADIGILVTKTMPPGMTRAAYVNGIYICSIYEYKTITLAYRNALIDLNKLRKAGENQKDKQAEMYIYLNSNEFKQYMEGVVDCAIALDALLSKDKRMQIKSNKEREKCNEKLSVCISSLSGAFQAISGGSIGDIHSLESNDKVGNYDG